MVEIPYSDNYFLDENMAVFCGGQEVFPDKENRYEITFVRNKRKFLTRETLILLCFKKPSAYTFSYFLEQEAVLIDSNKSNKDVKNLVWLISNRMSMKGFVPIPGYSRYGANAKGEIWDYEEEKLNTTYINGLGYLTTTVWGDGKDRSITAFVHRLIALALLAYPCNVSNLTVNHIDGNKLNNLLDNLEWCTKAYNNLHATLAGLRKDNKEILVRDVKTNVVTKYASHRICATALGFEATVIDRRAKSKGQKVFSDNRQYMDVVDSEKYEWNDNYKICGGAPKKLHIKNTISGEILEFISISSAARHIDVKMATLAKRIAENRRLSDNWVLHQSSSLDNNDVSFLSNAGRP